MVDFTTVKAISIPEGDVKVISRNGTVLWKAGRLPGAYQEVEYIQSTGTQYIDTGFSPNGATGVEISLGNVTVNGVLFGAYNSTWTTGYGMYCNANLNFWYHYYSNSQISFTPPTNFIMKFEKGKTIINGVQKASISQKTFTVSKNLYLFAGNMAGSLEQPTQCKLYYAQIYDDGVLRSHYIPCYRRSDGEIGLYDLVRKEFKTNQGNGTFIKGGNV